jgi:hypothetical protein
VRAAVWGVLPPVAVLDFYAPGILW